MSSYRTRENINVEARVEGDAVRIIEYAHVAVHDDGFVLANDYVADLDIATPRTYLVVGPTLLELHIVLNIVASAAVIIDVYHNPTVSANGTAIRHFRPNLWSSQNVISTYHTPTVTDDGTLKWKARSPGNEAPNANNRVGGWARNGEEIILPSGDLLLVRITAEADNTKLSFFNEYYEVPDGSTDR